MNKNGLQLNDNEDENNQFTSLFLQKTLDCSQFKQIPTGEIPFDLCCPSQKELLETRTCVDCGIYHGTKKSLIFHRRQCKKRKTPPTSKAVEPATVVIPRMRPQRLAARRQQERMIVWTSRLNDQHVDWFDENELDISDIEGNVTEAGENPMPVIDIDNYMKNPWEDSKE